uniref:receptor-like protein 36 n=1 Tax=Erigeron canadensis TaxID=72917 RepID=UPI001CB90D52|nr:receptor-like protein 36 [Erigeron canadensis]
MNWNTSTTNCCYWDGVSCNHSTGDVIGLDLSCGMLQGTLHPNTSLFNLPHLQTLNLAFNDFTDSLLPSKIGRLSSTLTHLNISVCGFSGQVPSDVMLLHKLVSLDLSGNYFRLEPRVFINLLQNHTSLEELSLAQVYIVSMLPTHLNISSSLKLLDLSSTGLQGNIPRYIFSLQSLEKLDLSWNGFTGEIPWEISLLPKLVSLDLSFNQYDNLSIKPHIFESLLQNSTLLRFLRLRDVNIGLDFPAYLNISSSMKSLDLTNTSLKGKLPNNIFNLQYLEHLYLSENHNITGPLPKVNDTIPLKALSLASTNFLFGKIPNSIGNFKSLTYLDLSYCSLTGPIPKFIGNLRYLTFLDLSSNQLNGTLPSFIGNLRNLTTLVLSSNKLSGTLSSSIFSLWSLESLSLDDNQFDGQIDMLMFQQLTNLAVLRLSYNNFGGSWDLDTILSSLPNISTLDLSYSGVSVSTSNATHYDNPNVWFLSLASCKIKVFPESVRSMTDLGHLDLSSNEIHGQIPHWLGEMGGSKLYRLSLSHNFIQGPFHPSICNMRNLMHLDLSNNSFDGVIPECFGDIVSSLQTINLGRNHFQGTIPNVYEKCGRLEGVILNRNQFEGEVPSSLSKCQHLRVLDMGNNHLNGTFPHWLESLPNLQVLVLKSNSFYGHIIPSSTVGLTFPSLQVMDLSHNGFEGQLPRKYFQNFNTMKKSVERSTTSKYLYVDEKPYSFVVTVKGVEQDFAQLYVYYTIVCLSHNNFVGRIPDIIGNLNSLIVLDLSHNRLTGQIPHTVGQLSEIESLDLSCNQLTGKIPQSLADLWFLGFLNLSQNHLVGLIPVGKQLNTFQENSFEGNPNLCGLPLSKECSDNHLQDPQHDESEGDGVEEKISGLTWIIVMLGYGFGTLFGLVMGYLMLSTGRPMWFNAIVDAMEQMIMKRRDIYRRCVIK